MPQQVKKITVENFKGVKEVQIDPEGRALVVVAGPNGAGKSSVLDAVQEIIDPKGTRLTPKPIREGAKEARAEIVTDGIRLERVWKKNGAGTLSAYATDGAKYSSGRDVVAKLTGGLLFDPSVILTGSDKDVQDVILQSAGVADEYALLQDERQARYVERRDRNRDATRAKGALEGAPVGPFPEREPDAAAAQAAVDAWENVARAMDLQERAQAKQVRAEDALKEAQHNLQTAMTEHTKAIEALEAVRVEAVKLAPTGDAAREQIGQLTEQAARYHDGVRRRVLEADAQDAATAAQRAAADLTATEEKIDKLLADADIPVEGLAVTEDGLTIDGVPFRQVNSARRLQVAFELATAQRPDLRLVIIRDGDLLDSDTLAAVAKSAEGSGYLVLVERSRDESSKIGFTISQGEVVSEPSK